MKNRISGNSLILPGEIFLKMISLCRIPEHNGSLYLVTVQFAPANLKPEDISLNFEYMNFMVYYKLRVLSITITNHKIQRK